MTIETSGRRPTHEVRIGHIRIGGGNPLALQTMTDRDTLDTLACVEQIERIREAGCRIVRLTTQTEKHTRNLNNIRCELGKRGIADVALVADVHFSPEVALTAAEYADKVRINPGNYKNPAENLPVLIAKCREGGVSIRIGVNHGSLSPHIMNRYGDTPLGMVESAMEMLKICRAHDFDQVVISMKSSNVRVMIHAYRLLAAKMDEQGMTYPLHMGVTEAGSGLDGRIKSSVGIGSLLAEGIGDTLRVSLTEPPENEIPVARMLAEKFERIPVRYETPQACQGFNPFEYSRRHTLSVGNLGGGRTPLLFEEINEEALSSIAKGDAVILDAESGNTAFDWRERIIRLTEEGWPAPVVLRKTYGEPESEKFAVDAASDFGVALIDGLADGVDLIDPHFESGFLREIGLSIMQAARVRISKTEFIACPGCGRTLFDLHRTLESVKSRLSHLRNLKIGVMGCIVNGPGEMADADYGYVGAGPGKVTLYKGREPLVKSVPQEDAVDALIRLIKDNGDWIEPADAQTT